MSRNTKIILAVVGVLILAGGLAVGLYLVRQRQELRSKAAPATTLKVSPASQSKLPGQTVTFTVLMNTGSNSISGVDLNLTYNPDVIEVESILKGSGISAFDQITKNSFDSVSGTISYSAFTANATAAVTGPSLEALRITGRVLDDSLSGSYQIAFSTTTTTSGVETGDNVLVGSTPGTLLVLAAAGATATASPTGSPTASPSGTPTASPTSTATASATATATPDELLDAGVSLPTILSAGFGALLILGSFLLIF